MSTLVHASQRRTLRRALRFHCQLVRGRDFKLVGSRAVDLSPDGMLVYCDDRILTGEDMWVSFRVPKTRLWFDVEARVARVIHGRRPTDRGRCVGLSFESLDDASRRTLRSSLHGLPPPIPAREQRVDYAATVHLVALQ